jgi:hypothetical protein
LLRRRLQGDREHGSISCIVQHKEKENKTSPKITHMYSRDLNR